jgi:flagellar biosynthetic protein FliQ
MITDLMKESVYVIAVTSGLPLLLAAIVGLVVSVLQAATQIQEQSVPYVLKLSSVLVVGVFFGDAGLDLLVRYVQRIFSAVAHFGAM